MLIDTLVEVVGSGGWVLIPIWLVGALGFYLGSLVFIEMRHDFFRTNYSEFFLKFLDRMETEDYAGAIKICKSHAGMISACLIEIANHAHVSEEALKNLLKVKLNKEIARLDLHLPLVSVLAASAPLLGLLGTVTGMVHTFQVITEFGNSNPVLMADGISEALIATQSGLLIAVPLVILKHRLEEKITWQTKQVELIITQYINQHYHKA